MPWMVRFVGVIVTLGLVGVSLMMNFRFGQSLGKTEWDGLVYGIASACADGFKVILPFAIMSAWTSKRRFASAAGAVLWMIITAYSMTSSLGHSAVNRAETSGTKRHQVATYQDLRRAMELKLQEREKLPAFRAQGALETEVRTQQRHWSFEQTSSCTEAIGRHRSFCDTYAKLTAELATAKRAAGLDREILELREQISAAAEKGSSGEADAQAAILKQISGLADDYVRLGLTLLVSVMVELGSGLGLYVVLGHRTGAEAAADELIERPMAQLRLPRLLAGPSQEAMWRKRRLVAAVGEHVDELSLYRDYCGWLIEERRGPALTLSAFRTWLASERVGEVVRKRGRTYYTGLRLRSSAGGGETGIARIG